MSDKIDFTLCPTCGYKTGWIEQLEAENERLRAALEKIAGSDLACNESHCAIARQALHAGLTDDQRARASARAMLQRLPIINDTVITEALDDDYQD